MKIFMMELVIEEGRPTLTTPVDEGGRGIYITS